MVWRFHDRTAIDSYQQGSDQYSVGYVSSSAVVRLQWSLWHPQSASIRRRLLAVADKLDPKQFGGLKGRSTTHTLVDMHAGLDSGGSTRVLFIDFVDHIDHNLVVDKLKSFGLLEIITDWITSFLCDRQQRTTFDGYFSSWVVLRGGMPQGSWSGPLVFLILIDDLKLDLLITSTLTTRRYQKWWGRGQDGRMQSVVD